jgi:ribosomal protein S18 acetylase RimI-like enzyme
VNTVDRDAFVAPKAFGPTKASQAFVAPKLLWCVFFAAVLVLLSPCQCARAGVLMPRRNAMAIIHRLLMPCHNAVAVRLRGGGRDEEVAHAGRLKRRRKRETDDFTQEDGSEKQATDRPLVVNQATGGQTQAQNLEPDGQGGARGDGERRCEESGVVLTQVVALKGATRSSDFMSACCTMTEAEVFDWTKVKVFSISPKSDVVPGSRSVRTLLELIRELFGSNSGFLNNMSRLFECFSAGLLYGLRLEETDDMLKYRGGHHPFFMQSRDPWTLPAFCCLDSDGAVDFIWVHPRLRRRGFASAFLHQLNVTQANNILPESRAFWNKHPTLKCSHLERDNDQSKCNHCKLIGFPLVDRPPQDVKVDESKSCSYIDPRFVCCICTHSSRDLQVYLPSLHPFYTAFQEKKEERKNTNVRIAKRLERLDDMARIEERFFRNLKKQMMDKEEQEERKTQQTRDERAAKRVALRHSRGSETEVFNWTKVKVFKLKFSPTSSYSDEHEPHDNSHHHAQEKEGWGGAERSGGGDKDDEEEEVVVEETSASSASSSSSSSSFVNLFQLQPLIRELFESNSVFLHNMSTLFECASVGLLYGLRLEETVDMDKYKYRDGHHPFFMESRDWTLPALCCLDQNGAVDMLWVHPRVRRRGFASAFLHQLNVTQATTILPESRAFWEKHPTVKYSHIQQQKNHYNRCNHWTLTGFPLVDKPYQVVKDDVLERKFDPWNVCPICKHPQKRAFLSSLFSKREEWVYQKSTN